MFNNLSAASIPSTTVRYPIVDSNLSFSDYMTHSRTIIEERRLNQASAYAILSNCPFELYPTQPIWCSNRLKYGVLLIHGLLDCPFSLKDIGRRLQANGMLCRAILLPGHGTTPHDLLQVSYHDWLQAVRYGVDTLRHEVDRLYLIGYSTGATLSVYQALQDNHIAGIVLLSPAIHIKAPVNIVAGWHYLIKCLTRNGGHWVYSENEIDYAKYKSIAFNPVKQVSRLTAVIRELCQHHPLNIPTFMIMSDEDETISSQHAIQFFSSLPHQENKLLLYTASDRHYADPRILSRQSRYPELGIKHFSHASLPFAPTNPHYGQHGDYIYASHDTNEAYYGAYNRIEEKWHDFLYQMGFIKKRRRELTYNPDFDFMADKIVQFITNGDISHNIKVT